MSHADPVPADAAAHARVAAFLATPAAHGLAPDAPVEFVRTHGAFVFLAGGSAVKLKRDVRYDYMDLSTPERRRALLERELELNAPAAPDIYRDVVPVTREADGLRIDGAGAPVEWVLRMRRFDGSDELDRVLADGRMDGVMAADLGRAIARMHRAAPVRQADGADLVAEIVEELGRVLPGLPALDAPLAQRLLDGLAREAARLAPLLRERSGAGLVRRCHGDLHLRNVVLLDGVPTPFDALEFDERLGTCDLLYDLAFMLMDLMHEGARTHACRTLDAWLGEMRAPPQEAGLAALPLFLSLRAAVRAMTSAQAGLTGSGYLAEADAYLRPPPPRLIAVGGLSGSGKTALARRVAHLVDPPPGALHVRSDAERKALAGMPETQTLPASAYTPEARARVYAACRSRARAALSAGHSVILDAVFDAPGERTAARDLARELRVPFAGVWIDAPADVMEGRIAARRGDASDADAAVLRTQLASVEPAADWRHVQNGGTLSAGADALAAALVRLQETPSSST